VAYLDGSRHRALDVASVGADSVSSTIGPGSSGVESISRGAELGFSRQPLEAHGLLRPSEVHFVRRNPQLYLSLGFEYRIEYEYDDNWMFGAGPQDHNGYVMDRVMPHFDLSQGLFSRR